MRAPTFALATATLLAAVLPVFAEPEAEPQDVSPANVASPIPATDEIPAFEIEKIRQQLGPEFSIESKELDISFDRPQESGKKPSVPGETTSTKVNPLDQKLGALAEETRQQARQLEELASQAEIEEQYVLADNLRELARQKWQMARVLSKPVVELKHPAKSPRIQVTFPSPYSQPSATPTYLAPISAAPAVVYPAGSTPPTCEVGTR